MLTGLRFYFAVNQESQERKAWENSWTISSLSYSSLQNHLLIPELETYSKEVGLRWLCRWLEELSEEVFSSESFDLLSVPWFGWQRLWIIPHTLKRKTLTTHATYLLILSCGYGQWFGKLFPEWGWVVKSAHGGLWAPLWSIPQILPSLIHCRSCATLSVSAVSKGQLRWFRRDLLRLYKENRTWRAGEMEKWLRGHAALPEDPGSAPTIHMAAYNLQNCSSRRSSSLLHFRGFRYICCILTYMQAKAP